MIILSSSRSSLISQEVDPRAPRNIIARAEFAATGQKTMLSSGLF